jgi:hypothetical protein
MTIAMREANERTSEHRTHRGKSPATHEVNRAKLALLRRVLDEQLALALSHGFHGTTAIELAVQDGTIQHVLHRVERMEK